MSDEQAKSIYRVHIKRHNADKTETNREFFVEAINDKEAVQKVLQHEDAPAEFGTINVNCLRSATLVM